MQAGSSCHRCLALRPTRPTQVRRLYARSFEIIQHDGPVKSVGNVTDLNFATRAGTIRPSSTRPRWTFHLSDTMSLRSPASPGSLPLLVQVVILLLALPFAVAQFGGFFQGGFPFGGGGHQHHEPPKRPDRQYKGWTEMEGGMS